MSNSACPRKEKLLAYESGELPEEAAGAVIDHLPTCPACQAAVETLVQADPLATGLRRPAMEAAYSGEPEFASALSRAKATIAQGLGGTATRQEVRQHAAPDADLPDDLAACPGQIAIDGSLPSMSGSGSVVLGQVGPYRLLAKLGQGGMGAVFKAMHVPLNRIVAIKLLPRHQQRDPKAIARFEREMLAIGQLDHPNLVRAHDAGTIEGIRFLAMEHIDGVDLSELVRAVGPLSVPDACEIVRQAAIGLQYAHENGLVHRDIKPSNLMLDESGRVKILDLGLARLVTQTTEGEEVTGTGEAMGTVDYMAPEQGVDSHAADIRADIYSLGCTFYKLLTGRAPYQDDRHASIVQKLVAHANEPAPPLGDMRDDIPGAVAELTERMLAKAPERRPAAPREVAETLEAWSSGSNPAALAAKVRRPGATPGEPPRAPSDTKNRLSQPDVSTERELPRRRRIAATGIAMLAVAILLFGAYQIVIKIQKKGQPPTTIVVEDGSHVEVKGGAVAITPPDAATAASVPPAKPLLALARPSSNPIGWRNDRFDVCGTSHYPFPGTKRTAAKFEVYPWRNAVSAGPVSGFATGDLVGDACPEVAAVEGLELAVYDRSGRELWRRNPVVESQVSVPAGRVGDLSPPALADADGDGRQEVIVVAGSRPVGAWNQRAPARLIAYRGDGEPLKSFSVLDGGVCPPGPCFDHNGDGHDDIALCGGVFRHPHAVSVCDLWSETLLFRKEFADGTVIAGRGDVHRRPGTELFLITGFDCHVDPPVEDYDSDHCYAVLFGADGQRIWKQTYRHCLNGTMADLDGDGRPEIVLMHETETTGSLHILDPDSGAPRATAKGLYPHINRAWSIADVLGNGLRQIVVADGRQLYLFDGKAAKLASRDLPNGEVAATADLNGDGRNEIIVRKDDELLLFDGQLREIARHKASGKIHRAVVTDLDGDGVPEVLMREGPGDTARIGIVRLASAPE